ncbi:hypothetical protein [Streptosporangium sp. NPDC003464]
MRRVLVLIRSSSSWPIWPPKRPCGPAHRGRRDDWPYASLVGRLLLDHGRLFTPADRPAHIQPGPPGSCFASATRIAEAHDLIYVEGMALVDGLPVGGFDHAWCVDARDGHR